MLRESRTGVGLKLGGVGKDSQGFDDLDEFWEASGMSPMELFCTPCSSYFDSNLDCFLHIS